MKNALTEARFQFLAGVINENEFKQLNEISDDSKALGILFYPNEDENEDEDEYEWNHDAIINLVKDMGYEDYEEVSDEFTHIFSPGDEDEMRIFRQRLNNPNLQPTDLTIGMYKQAIEQEFPEKNI
jgi:hypothetical protein